MILSKLFKLDKMTTIVFFVNILVLFHLFGQSELKYFETEETAFHRRNSEPTFHTRDPRKNRVPPNGEDPRHRQIVNWKRTWPNGLIFFEISPEFNATTRDLIYGSMAEISEKTCIQFKKRTFEPDYIYFQMKYGDGCHTYAGKKGGRQILNLDPRKCIQHGKAGHELLHVIGFHHEHQRPDRDKYIDIKWENIKDEDIGQFTKLSAPKEYLSTFGYDYGSLLHYGNISFFLAIDQDKPILEAKQYAPNMGQRLGLSEMDALKVNALYKCPKGESLINLDNY